MDEIKIISPVHPVKEKRLFKGDAHNPFLAPRGVFICNNKLIVSDTGQNRVFIWNEIPHQEYQSPDIVLGQEANLGTSRNKGVTVSGSSLQYPSGIWTNGELLIVADAWNHRVLIWHAFPKVNGQKADVVIGQLDFESNEPNIAGIGKAPSAKSLNWPYGVYAFNGRLFIADTGNRRVLVFNSIPKINGVSADAVIGAPNFIEKEYDPQSAIWPYSIKISEQGEVAITDTQYFRVLYWNSIDNALTQQPGTVLGQPDLQSNGQNQYLLQPAANTLNWCYDAHFYKNGIWIADTGNSRLLWHSSIANQPNKPAEKLLGHSDFTTGSENMDTILTTENSLYWPFSISMEDDLMAVADTGNHRIIFYQLE